MDVNTTMLKSSNHARPDEGASITSHILETMMANPTIDNVNEILRFARLLICIRHKVWRLEVWRLEVWLMQR